MRYLITNDDGINATGLKILAKIAKNFGNFNNVYFYLLYCSLCLMEAFRLVEP